MSELTPKQKVFADHYIISLNITESAKKAGYSPKTAAQQGSRIFKDVKIQNYIQERLAEKDSGVVAKQDEILEFLTSVMRGEVKDQLGFETSVRDRKSAAELLGKRYGLFVDKIEHTGSVGVVISDDI